MLTPCDPEMELPKLFQAGSYKLCLKLGVVEFPVSSKMMWQNGPTNG